MKDFQKSVESAPSSHSLGQHVPFQELVRDQLKEEHDDVKDYFGNRVVPVFSVEAHEYQIYKKASSTVEHRWNCELGFWIIIAVNIKYHKIVWAAAYNYIRNIPQQNIQNNQKDWNNIGLPIEPDRIELLEQIIENIAVVAIVACRALV